MKHLLLTTIAALVLVGCATTQQSAPPAEANTGVTPLHRAASKVHNKIAKLLIEEGADVNAVNKDGLAPLDYAENETFGFLIDHGAKSGAELKAEGK